MIMEQTKTLPAFPVTLAELENAYLSDAVITVVPAKMDEQQNLLVELKDGLAVIPPDCCDLGLRPDGSNRYCLAAKYLGRPMQCKVAGQMPYKGQTVLLLDHTCVQQALLESLTPGTVVDATVTSFIPSGAFCELDCGLATLLPIARMSISRMSHPSDMLSIGQHIKAVVYSVSESGRVVLSLKELLGTWEENCAGLHVGDTLLGIVRSMVDYGVFIQLGSNLSGLSDCEDREFAPGNLVAVMVKKIEPDKMKVKLSIYNVIEQSTDKPVLEYHLPESGHLAKWQYSPAGCSHTVETVFDGQPTM